MGDTKINYFLTHRKKWHVIDSFWHKDELRNGLPIIKNSATIAFHNFFKCDW